jgi:hypothetical protein
MRTVSNWLRTSVLAAVVVVGAMATNAMAAVVTYTLTGGGITGTLNGTAFSGKDFTITATADPSTFSQGSLNGSIPIVYTTAASTMTIDGFAPFQVTSSNFGVFIADYSSVFPGTFAGGFGIVDLVSDGSVGIASVGSPTGDPLNGPGMISGSTGADNYTYTTTAGNLSLSLINISDGVPVTFTAGGSPAVPEPTSMAIFGLGALGFAYRNRRKLMK